MTRRGGPGIWAVAGGVGWRALHNAVYNPALLIPSIVFPLFFLVAFAGGLSTIADVPGFDFPSGYTSFQFVFVLLQSAAFSGVFIGIGIAGDFESGFGRRLMLAAPRRSGIVLGYVLAAMARYSLTLVLLFVVGLLAGMQVDGGPVDLFGLVGLAYLVNVAATLFGAGAALRLRSLQAAPAMQIPVFLSLFLAPVYVPLDLLEGWIKGVASVNPATALLEAGRGFISGEPTGVALAFAAALGLGLLFSVWALTGLRRAEAAGA
jgi:ABC-2 type transport system permease protein